MLPLTMTDGTKNTYVSPENTSIGGCFIDME